MSRNPIQDHFVILCSKLNVDKVLPYLKQERMVTTDEYEMLTSPNFTTRQKREKLLIWLPRKGRNYFTNFGKCLVWSGQTELARHIGVDVALVPEPPFQLPEEEPSPAEQQQQIVNILRGIMSSGQPPPAYSPSSAPQHNYAPHPAPPLANGGVSALSKAHQPSTNTGEHIFLPGQSGPRGPGSNPVPPPAEPMDLSGPVVPQHLRPDRNVLRASTANHEPAAVPQPQRKGKVFILYCKDGLPQEFSDEVLDLADTLSSCGGFKCEVDHYIDVPPPNWNTWTIKQIQESEYVLLVYSPILDQQIHSTQNIMLNMEKGKYYANGIINLMHPPKFIPVYLNGRLPPNNLGWLPPQLHTCTEYMLNINQLRMAIEVPEGTPEHIFSEKLTEALHNDRFRDVAKLVSHLRGESDTARPNPPLNPIKVPAVPNPSHNAHPQSQIVRSSPVAHPQSQMHQVLAAAPRQHEMPLSAHFDNARTQVHHQPQMPQPFQDANSQSQPQVGQPHSGFHREPHVEHPQSDPNVSYHPLPQVYHQPQMPQPLQDANSQSQPQVGQHHSGFHREPHVEHPLSDPNVSYRPLPQVYQPPHVANMESQEPEPSNCMSGLQRESHVAHPQSDTRQTANGAYPRSEVQRQYKGARAQSGMEVSGSGEETMQSFEHPSLNFTEAHQSITEYEAHDIRDITMKKIGLKMKENWFRLGEYLGVQHQQLTTIQQSLGEHPKYDYAMLTMLNAWRETKKQQATKEALKQALRQLNYGYVAEEYLRDD